MQAIERWKHKVRTAAIGQEPNQVGTFWDEERATWFNRFAGRSDRSQTYRFMAPYVHGQVLEIGPGPGAYTRHLVAAADHVIAVEPSPYMARFLRQNLGPCSHLEIVESSIEAYLNRLEEYDFALAANVLEGIERIDEVLGNVAAHTQVFSIVTWANAVTPAWLQAIEREILGREIPSPDAPSNEDLLSVLEELGLRYQVHRPNMSVHSFATLDDLLAWVEGFVGLEPGRRNELTKVLQPFIGAHEGHLGLPRGQESLVVNVF